MGALYLINHIEDDRLAADLRKWLKISFVLFLIPFLYVVYRLFTMEGFAVDTEGVVYMQGGKYLQNLLQMPMVLSLFLLGVLLVVGGVAGSLLKPTFRRGIWLAAPGAVFVVMALFMIAGYNNTAYYPSTADIQSSLTLANSCSSEFTLRTMAVVSLIIPFVVAYIAYAWRQMDKQSLTRGI